MDQTKLIKMREDILEFLEECNDTKSVNEIMYEVVEDPTWEERQKVQKVLGDLLIEGKVAQTPEWEYTA